MDSSLIIGGLVTAIGSMAGFIVFLFKTIIADKDRQLAAKDEAIAKLEGKLDDSQQTLNGSLKTVGDALEILKERTHKDKAGQSQGQGARNG